MNHLVMKNLRQRVAFVNTDSGWRSGTCLQNVGNDAGVIQMPMPFGNFCVHASPLGTPTSSRHLITESVIAKGHDVVDAGSLVAVVIVV